MANSYVGEIRLWAGFRVPANWAICDGSSRSIADYTSLFNLIGTTYGGDGTSAFNLPDLRGRVPIHMGSGPGLQPYSIGQNGGSETVTLNASQIAAHGHVFKASTGASQGSPGGAYLGSPTAPMIYVGGTPTAPMAGTSIASTTGGGQPHENMMPFLVINFIISLFGVYPSKT